VQVVYDFVNGFINPPDLSLYDGGYTSFVWDQLGDLPTILMCPFTGGC